MAQVSASVPASVSSPRPLERPLAARTKRISVSATAAMVIEADRLRAEGRDLVDFGVGEPDFPTPAHITEAAITALRQNVTKYTATGGTRELREAIVQAHHRELGSGYKVPECLATMGGKHALFNAISVLVDHGDEVILPAPYWVSFYDQITYAGGTPVVVQTEEEQGFGLSLAALEAAITARTKVILLNSPSNPSGAIFTPDTFRAVLEICKQRGIWLLSDECYVKFLYDAAPYSVASEPGSKDFVVIAGSLSKTYAMTGWRLGFALAPAPIVKAMINLQSHSTSNPTSFVQKGALAALNGTQAPVAEMLAEYRRRREIIVSGLRAIPGVTCVMPAGAFYAYPNISQLLGGKGRPATAMEFSTRLLQEAGVVTVPGEAFGTQHHLRFSYAAAVPVIEEGLRRFAGFCSQLS
jgi:aspartate aminotransferase